MSEQEPQQHKGQWYQGYSISAVNIEQRFQTKYGYPPDKIIITGGGILAGPIREHKHREYKHDSISNR